MSDTANIPSETPGEPAGGPPRRSGWLTALMVVAGVILLLPGLCAIIFGGIALSQPGSAGGFMPFVAIGLVVGFFGVIMNLDRIPQSKALRCHRMGPAAAKMTPG